MSPDIFLSYPTQSPSPSKPGVMSYYTDKAYSAQFLANSRGLEEMIVRREASEEHVKDGQVGSIMAARLHTNSSQSIPLTSNYVSEYSRKPSAEDNRFSRHNTGDAESKNTCLLNFKRLVN